MAPRQTKAILRNLLAGVAIATMSLTGLTALGSDIVHAQQRGPGSVADIAEGLLDSVVNISTSQTVKNSEDNSEAGGDDSEEGSDEGAENGGDKVTPPKLPEGSPFQEFFKDFFEGKQGEEGSNSHKVQSLGSGFVIDAEKGIIVTNNHVIADADDIEINFNDGSKLKAELIGKDTKTDLAVLKVDPSKHPLKAVEFGQSDGARIGDWVLAIGNPFGLGGTVTAGIISARKRDINSGPYDNFIQTDAAINRGNSGGPLFDMTGKVIGINTAIISPSGGSIGIGFAIPAEMAIPVIAQLREFGEVHRGWLGVRIQPITDDVATSLELKTTKGALIAGMIENSGVDNSALQPGDAVIRFDGKLVESARDLPRLVAESPVGKEVEIVIIRKGVEQTIKVKLGRLVEDDEKLVQTMLEQTKPKNGDQPNAKPDAPKKDMPADDPNAILGMKLGELTEQSRSEYGIGKEVTGALVTFVAPGTSAGDKRIEVGDVIVDINQIEIKKPADVKRRIEALRREGRKNALLMLSSRSGELRFVTVRID